jgi:hypothetical protein
MTKYNSRKVVLDGITFDSAMESKYYTHLSYLKYQNVVKDFKLQPVYELLPKFTVNGKKRLAIKYKADFEVEYADGTVEVIDVKGFETADFKIKKKLFEYKYSTELRCVTFSKIDGGWIDLDQLKKNRAARRKERKNKKKG